MPLAPPHAPSAGLPVAEDRAHGQPL
jgi:hypothetical protein